MSHIPKHVLKQLRPFEVHHDFQRNKALDRDIRPSPAVSNISNVAGASSPTSEYDRTAIVEEGPFDTQDRGLKPRPSNAQLPNALLPALAGNSCEYVVMAVQSAGRGRYADTRQRLAGRERCALSTFPARSQSRWDSRTTARQVLELRRREWRW